MSGRPQHRQVLRPGGIVASFTWLARRAIAMRCCSTTAWRARAPCSVDGVNAISGETAAVSQSAACLRPDSRPRSLGWRKNMEEVATFYFTSVADYLRWPHGAPGKHQVIGVAVYREEVPRRWRCRRLCREGRCASAPMSLPDAASPASAAPSALAPAAASAGGACSGDGQGAAKSDADAVGRMAPRKETKLVPATASAWRRFTNIPVSAVPAARRRR